MCLVQCCALSMATRAPRFGCLVTHYHHWSYKLETQPLPGPNRGILQSFGRFARPAVSRCDATRVEKQNSSSA